MQTLPEMIAAERVYPADLSRALKARNTTGFCSQLTTWHQPRGDAVRPLRRGARQDFWESFCYLIIWLSSLLGIGICFG